ncbi:hypothetical protein SAMN05216345_13310 [Cupriavidus sp. YR651]|nr:hypothetical protein SAMN05216345_13310 [Cupriavidus sp. YR651]
MLGWAVSHSEASLLTTGLAAEEEGRRWASTEPVYDYVHGAAERFATKDSIEILRPLAA